MVGGAVGNQAQVAREPPDEYVHWVGVSNPDGALSVKIRYAAQRLAGVVRPGSVGAARRSAGALRRVRDAGWPPGAGRPKQHDPALAECGFRRFPPFLRFRRRGRAAIAAAPSPERCRRHRSRRHHRIHRHYPLAEGRSANRLVVPSAPLSEKPCRRRGRTVEGAYGSWKYPRGAPIRSVSVRVCERDVFSTMDDLRRAAWHAQFERRCYTSIFTQHEKFVTRCVGSSTGHPVKVNPPHLRCRAVRPCRPPGVAIGARIACRAGVAARGAEDHAVAATDSGTASTADAGATQDTAPPLPPAPAGVPGVPVAPTRSVNAGSAGCAGLSVGADVAGGPR